MTAANTGPDYPPVVAVPPSSAIGLLEIGVSSIQGTSTGLIPFNYWQTIISQYANSTAICALIGSFSAAIDQTQNINLFYDNMLNIASAQGYGLDCWGRIVGVTRALYIPAVEWFGFSQAEPGITGFGLGPFYSGETLTDNYLLSDDDFRTLIYAKALANISNGSIPSINQILLQLFPGRGNCYVTDGAQYGPYFGFVNSGTAKGFGLAPFYSGQPVSGMTMAYTFQFQLTPVELAIVQQSGVLPKPSGVAASVVTI